LAEFALYFTVIIGAIIAMSLYVRRNLQARYKSGADFAITQIRQGLPDSAGLGRQYDPYYQTSNYTTNTTTTVVGGFPESSVDSESISWGRQGIDTVLYADD